MQKRRYEILLPLKFNDGQPVPAEALNQTREELLARFEGPTVHPYSLLGIWQHEGQRYEDELVRLTVDVEDTEENQFFFSNLKTTLLERFQQVEIYIVSYPINRL
jgi:ATP-dependent protease HslVU (ClpYQ) peptidase subunit